MRRKSACQGRGEFSSQIFPIPAPTTPKRRPWVASNAYFPPRGCLVFPQRNPDMAQHFLLSAECRNFARSELNAMSDAQILGLMARLRWGDEHKQVCPGCGVVDQHYFRKARSQWRCKHCGRDFSVTSGTPFHGHKLPLRDILNSIYSFVVHADGISAAMLCRELGCQWRTAWLLQSKLREVIIKYRPLEPMSGITQMDGAYFCGKRRSVNKHGYRDKSMIGAAICWWKEPRPASFWNR